MAGHVNVGLTAICYALFTTAATIIRQLINRYGRAWGIILPLSGYVAAAAAVVGFSLATGLLTRGDTPGFVAGHVMVGLSAICTALIALVASIVRQDTQRIQRQRAFRLGVARRCCGHRQPGAWTIFEAAGTEPAFFVGAHVLVGLGAICFTLFSIVSILEEGTS
ncbi:DUF2776 family protein [Arthrobacter sp. NPDC097144]|uniref:DUF2776 family protein n=1 Tax=Arthrobacter sp. NPDC097144 TaxID=3363946 RepID=UPI0037F34FD2